MELVEFIGVVSISLLFTKYFQPIQPAKDAIVNWLIGKIVRVGIKYPILMNLTQVVKLLTCPKCLSFWTLLFITHNLFIGATGAVVAMVVDNMLVKTQDNGDK